MKPDAAASRSSFWISGHDTPQRFDNAEIETATGRVGGMVSSATPIAIAHIDNGANLIGSDIHLVAA